MRRRWGVVIATLLLTASPSLQARPVTPRIALAPGDPAPLLRGISVESGEVVYVDWGATRLTLVNFWATWCVPCRDELPALQELFTRFKGEGLAIIGVTDQTVPNIEILSFTSMLGVRYPIVRIRSSISAEWGGVSALPASFLIGQDGKVVRRYVGATAEQVAGLVADVEAQIAGRPLAPMVVPPAPRVSTFENPTAAVPEKAP